MTWQTSRKGTSFVRVYPWRTLGSARVAVEEEVQGAGMSKGSSAVSNSGGVEAAELFSLWRCLRGPWLENVVGMCGLNLCLFSSLDILSASLEEDLGSPSQTSISMHLHPRTRTLDTTLVRFHMPDCRFSRGAGRTFLYASVLD